MTEAQARILNEKLENAVKSGKIFNIGFNQTGHFSIGYTIYTREADYVCPSCGAALGRFPSQTSWLAPIIEYLDTQRHEPPSLIGLR